MAQVHWIRSNGFVLGLILAVGLAFAWPEPGSRHGFLQPQFTTNAGIALILFLQGLSLAMDQVRSGAGNWRLHGIIQSFTFVIFPLVGLGWYALGPLLWPGEPPAIRSGFLFLCVLPSTISTSVVLTAVARGNTAGALFNAALSNILGVFLTPLLVQVLLRSAGQQMPFGPLLVKILLLTLVPFFTGMFARRWVGRRIKPLTPWIARISNAIIIFIVYCAFCDSVVDRVWERHGWKLTGLVLLFVVVLFALMSGIIGATCRLLRLNREDAIAAYFCSVKKTLAMGVPLGMLIFGGQGDLSLILLPIMFYHPLQLFFNGLLAHRWSKQLPTASASTAAGQPRMPVTNSPRP